MRIAILSRNAQLYSTKRLVEAAEKRQHEVFILDHMRCYVVIEEGNPAIYYDGKKIPQIDAIIPRIGSSVTFYGTAIVRQFEMMGVFSVVKSLAIVRSRDKLRSLQVLSKAGVGLPKTAFANDHRDIEDVIKQVGGTPIVIKLLEGTQGIGVILADNYATAKSAIEAFYNLNAEILVQEFIKESKGMDIRAFIVNGEVVGAMKRQGQGDEFRSNLHRGGLGTLVELTDAEKQTAIKAAKAVGLDVAGVDMLRSDRGPLVIEVNSSPGLQGIEKATGLDIAGEIINYIERNIIQNHKDTVGV